MKKIGFIGAGNMAQAIIKGIINANVYLPKDILISDIATNRLDKLKELYGVTPAESNIAITQSVDVLILSVKPQGMSAVLKEIQGHVADSTLVISIAAGITTDYICRMLPNAHVVRSMPNTPAMVDEGAAALYSANALPEHMDLAMKLFSAIGKAVIVDKEELIDAVTAVSGSGPAYFFLLMEEMVRVAEAMQIPPDIAEELVYQTAKGAGVMAMQAYARNESPANLRRKVTSPMGTTEAAMNVFEKLDFAKVVDSALQAARARSQELSTCFIEE